jgi:type IV secretory pathway VirB2 component (pilin)
VTDFHGRVTRRHRSIGSLVVGLAALIASAYVITDGKVWLPGSVDWRWLLAGVAVAAGLLLLGDSVRNRS